MVKSKKSLTTLLVILGILISYLYMMAPSPLLGVLRDEFGIVNNDALLNLSVSIVYPMFIFASLLGGLAERRLGMRRMFLLTLIFLTFGMLFNFAAYNYTLFLIGRALYGFGYGLGIPFIGSFIMRYFDPPKQEMMNTVNGLFPFIGTVISFGFLVPLYAFTGDSWKMAFGIWGIVVAVITVFWFFFVPENHLRLMECGNVPQQAEKADKNIYRSLWKRKEIRLLCIAFVCDFFCYSYLGIILPTLFTEIGHWSEEYAGFMSAVAFPAVGILGCFAGGFLIASTGRRKPAMALGQLFKYAGITIMLFCSGFSVWFVVVGAALFGIGNSIWIPGMYTVTMELEGMSPAGVGAAFALILSCGFASGFLSPILGGALTNAFMQVSGISDPIGSHAFGLLRSLFLFGFTNLIGFVCIILLHETGPAATLRAAKTQTRAEAASGAK